MKPLFYIYICSKCNHSFKAPGISGELYGEFLMWSEKTGKVAYLNACNDQVFNEVEKLFDEIIKFKSIGSLDDSDIFQSIFSISCDLAEDGSQFHIGLKPICPYCGAREIASRMPAKPVEYVNTDVQVISHEKWNKLTNEEKKALIEEAVNNCLAIKH